MIPRKQAQYAVEYVPQQGLFKMQAWETYNRDKIFICGAPLVVSNLALPIFDEEHRVSWIALKVNPDALGLTHEMAS